MSVPSPRHPLPRPLVTPSPTLHLSFFPLPPLDIPSTSDVEITHSRALMHLKQKRYRWMDRWTEGRTNGRTDQQTDGQTTLIEMRGRIQNVWKTERHDGGTHGRSDLVFKRENRVCQISKRKVFHNRGGNKNDVGFLYIISNVSRTKMLTKKYFFFSNKR